jgi:hypothetical protein
MAEKPSSDGTLYWLRPLLLKWEYDVPLTVPETQTK